MKEMVSNFWPLTVPASCRQLVGEKEQIHETQNKHTCSSKNYRFFKSGEDQETCGGDLIFLFLKDNAPTA